MRASTWLMAAVLGLAACGGRAPPPAAPPSAPADAATRAATLEAAAPGLQKVDGRSQRGVEPSSYSAYFDHGQLRYLDERVLPPRGAPRRNRYFFDDGRLFYYVGEAAAGGTGGGVSALGPTVPVQAEFAGAKTLSAVRIEHFGAVRLEEAQAEEIRRQAAELASVAAAEQHAAGAR
jgi:hypothetical protein